MPSAGCCQVLPKPYGGSAELLPIDKACRIFKLPPFDCEGEELARIEAAAAGAASTKLSDVLPDRIEIRADSSALDDHCPEDHSK